MSFLINIADRVDCNASLKIFKVSKYVFLELETSIIQLLALALEMIGEIFDRLIEGIPGQTFLIVIQKIVQLTDYRCEI